MTPSQIVVAGHICLDIIPTFPSEGGSGSTRIEPGRLYTMGEAVCATGGVVSNTGLALHRLGVPPILMGKVSDDLFGGEVLTLLRHHHPALAEGMLITKGETTSYTIVINPPNVDRAFLHCSGTNDTYSTDNIDLNRLQNVSVFHFGYPPIMSQFSSDGGDNMRTLFEDVRERSVLTSLDMTMPDPESDAGKIDWRAWLQNVLPSVDLFLPSFEEILFMLDCEKFDQLDQSEHPIDLETLRSLSSELLEMGAQVVLLKLGEQGLYLRTSPEGLNLPGGNEQAKKSWADRELVAPCFEVNVIGTTGAGDCTIAGFLSAVLESTTPERALLRGVAVGGCNVEQADSTSGIRPWLEIQKRIDAGWERKEIGYDLPGWTLDNANGVWSH